MAILQVFKLKLFKIIFYELFLYEQCHIIETYSTFYEVVFSKTVYIYKFLHFRQITQIALYLLSITQPFAP